MRKNMKGKALTPSVSESHFWFAWAASKPATRMYTPVGATLAVARLRGRHKDLQRAWRNAIVDRRGIRGDDFAIGLDRRAGAGRHAQEWRAVHVYFRFVDVGAFLGERQ